MLLRIRSQSGKDQDELNHLRAEYEKFRSFKGHSEELLETVRRECKDRENQMAEQLQSSRSVEKQLKESLSQLSYDKADLEGKLKDLFTIVTEQERSLNVLRDMESSLRTSEERTDIVTSENEKLKYEIALLKESKESSKSRAAEDFKLLKEDLEMCTQLVKRQEQTISEMRKRKMQDDQELQALTSKCQKLQKEVTVLKESVRLEADERTNIAKKSDNLTGEIERLKAENAELLAQLNAMVNKEAIDRKQKEEYARMRLDLINMRNQEMAAFASALEGVPTRRYEGFGE